MAKSPKKARATPKFTATHAEILAECAFAVGQGLEIEMQKDPGKRTYALTPEAREFWLEYHKRSIPQAFEKYGSAANWAKDRPKVTSMAVVLGQIAAQNALKDPVNATSRVIQVTIENVEAATIEVREDPRCVRAKVGGRGIYCES